MNNYKIYNKTERERDNGTDVVIKLVIRTAIIIMYYRYYRWYYKQKLER